jgi:hypothetical protein
MRLAIAGQLAILALLAAALVIAASMVTVRIRPSAAVREKRRRLNVNRIGRMGDGFIDDFRDGVLYFSYSVRGVEYAASQDVDGLSGLLPIGDTGIVGPVTLKYAPQNPANSIVLCEEWSGLHVRGSETRFVPPPLE